MTPGRTSAVSSTSSSENRMYRASESRSKVTFISLPGLFRVAVKERCYDAAFVDTFSIHDPKEFSSSLSDGPKSARCVWCAEIRLSPLRFFDNRLDPGKLQLSLQKHRLGM